MDNNRQNILVILIGGLIIISSIYISTHSDVQEETAELIFLDNFNDAFRKAQTEDKPIYIYGRSEYCDWCKKFEAETLNDEKVKGSLKNNFILLSVDIIEQGSLSENLGIKGTPTSIFVMPDGHEIPQSRIVGFTDPDTFYAHLNEIISGMQ